VVFSFLKTFYPAFISLPENNGPITFLHRFEVLTKIRHPPRIICKSKIVFAMMDNIQGLTTQIVEVHQYFKNYALLQVNNALTQLPSEEALKRIINEEMEQYEV
jgi:hypothetical protein